VRRDAAVAVAVERADERGREPRRARAERVGDGDEEVACLRGGTTLYPKTDQNYCFVTINVAQMRATRDCI
jgi:hypothetical protein